MLEDLLNKDLWQEFLRRKEENEYIGPREKAFWKEYIDSEAYKPICKGICEGRYSFSVPHKHLITKNASGKKRTVYTFSDEEMIILKYLSFLLYRYDYLFSNNLYSFRKGFGVKDAVSFLSRTRDTGRMYGYKLDISSYFNSISPSLLLPSLKDCIDIDLFVLMARLLDDDRVCYRGEIIKEAKGAMPGTPISNFLANFYLKDLDHFFWKRKVIYLRYADDILLFAHAEEEIKEYSEYLKDYLHSMNLSINPEKESWITPGDPFDFLGFSFAGKNVDISHHSVEKIKGKISRKARALRRWFIAKELSPDAALKAMNRIFNSKFYGQDSSEMSWQYWYFPYITTATRLHEIDAYMQQYQRYIVTGRHYKMNFAYCPYDRLKSCGYKPLVPAYYAFREEEKEVQLTQ